MAQRPTSNAPIAKGVAKGKQNAEHSQAEPATAGSIGTSQLRRIIVVMIAIPRGGPKARILPITLVPHCASISITPTPESAKTLATNVIREGLSPKTSQATAAVINGVVAYMTIASATVVKRRALIPQIIANAEATITPAVDQFGLMRKKPPGDSVSL